MGLNAVGLDVFDGGVLNGDEPMQSLDTFNLFASNDALGVVDDESELRVGGQMLALVGLAKPRAGVEHDSSISVGLTVQCQR